MATMTKKRKSKIGRPPGPPNSPVTVRYLDSLIEALDELVRRNRRTRTIELTIALENHLKEAGLWPPPAEAAPKSEE